MMLRCTTSSPLFLSYDNALSPFCSRCATKRNFTPESLVALFTLVVPPLETLTLPSRSGGNWRGCTLAEKHILYRYSFAVRRTHHASADWFRADSTTAILQLPPIELLDEDFIDEARTTTFFEEGSWTAADKQKLYLQAKKAMKQRILTPEHLQQAQQNAKEQFSKIFTNLGYHEVLITFAKNPSSDTH